MSEVSPHELRTPEDIRRVELTLVAVRDLAHQLHPELTDLGRLGADASLERDFGLDSLARVELAHRLERALGSPISDVAMAEAETVKDLARALRATQAVATHAPVPEQTRPEPSAAGPPFPHTLVDALEWHATEQPDRAHILVLDHGTVPEPITFGALRAEAAGVAAGLVQQGVRPGEPVTIMLPTGREFFAAFYGVLYARAVPVPLYPPARASQIESHLRRVAGILTSCGARILLTFDGAHRAAQLLRSLAQLTVTATVAQISADSGAAWPAPPVRPDDTAFLQYTSGSTGQPKGVVLTHANLLANLHAMQRVTQISAADCFVSWLPLYHDMGLIGACLGALVFGFPLVLMSPFAFLTHPLRWLRAVQQHRGTITAAPNFAYEICISKIADADLATLSLSTLRMAFNGAEPVSARTLERFAERFAVCGLKRSALMPVYGLAEGALGLTFPPLGRGPLVDHIDRERFQRTGIAHASEAPEPASLAVVSCGAPLPGYTLRIIDAAGHPRPERTQGRIEFQGPSATSGYLNNPEATARLLDGKWLDTGDLGYLAAGELYITGRAKDIIIRGGHNIHPQELEEAIGQLAGVRKGGVVVFPATDRDRETERIIALVETRLPSGSPERPGLIAHINRLAIDLIGLPIDEVVLAPPRTVLKTSSGKIRRAACRDAYEHGKLGAAGRSPWIQLTRLRVAGLLAKGSRGALHVGAGLWSARALLVAACLAPVLWVSVTLTPGLRRRRARAAWLIRLAMRLAGIRVQVRSTAAAQPGQHMFVCNHCSYLDAPVLLTVMPPEVTFVAKRELQRVPLLGPLLRRLGCLFVERHALREAIAAADDLVARLKAGESFHVFAEGTLQRDPGLLPFHMGAFLSAASTGVPVVPVALCGTRAMLPDQAIIPRPGPIEVYFGEPLTPEHEGWDAALRLRAVSRAFILGQVHEPDLEQAAPAVP